MAGLLMAGSASAQTINFVNAKGEVIESGSTVICNEYEGNEFTGYEYKSGIQILSDENAKVNVKATCLTANITMCCGGLCESGETVEKKDVQLTANTPLDIKLDYFCLDTANEDYQNIAVTLDLKSAEFIGGSLSTITVIFNATEDASVDNIAADSAISYVNGELRYAVEGETAATIFDATGKAVVSTVVSGAGAISTDDLTNGIYVYRVGNKSGKILVK